MVHEISPPIILSAVAHCARPFSKLVSAGNCMLYTTPLFFVLSEKKKWVSMWQANYGRPVINRGSLVISTEYSDSGLCILPTSR